MPEDNRSRDVTLACGLAVIFVLTLGFSRSVSAADSNHSLSDLLSLPHPVPVPMISEEVDLDAPVALEKLTLLFHHPNKSKLDAVKDLSRELDRLPTEPDVIPRQIYLQQLERCAGAVSTIGTARKVVREEKVQDCRDGRVPERQVFPEFVRTDVALTGLVLGSLMLKLVPGDQNAARRSRAIREEVDISDQETLPSSRSHGQHRGRIDALPDDDLLVLAHRASKHYEQYGSQPGHPFNVTASEGRVLSMVLSDNVALFAGRLCDALKRIDVLQSNLDYYRKAMVSPEGFGVNYAPKLAEAKEDLQTALSQLRSLLRSIVQEWFNEAIH
jgi:hypothetical protein